MSFLTELMARGLTLEVDDAGRLRARPKQLLDDATRRAITAHSSELIRAVRNRQALATFVRDWMSDTCPDGYFNSPAVAAGPDADFWRRLEADLDAHCDGEDLAGFARRVDHWQAGAAERFRAWDNESDAA